MDVCVALSHLRNTEWRARGTSPCRNDATPADGSMKYTAAFYVHVALGGGGVFVTVGGSGVYRKFVWNEARKERRRRDGNGKRPSPLLPLRVLRASRLLFLYTAFRQDFNGKKQCCLVVPRRTNYSRQLALQHSE